MNKIYLDNSATTKIDEKVIEAMNEAFAFFGNPSSVHSFGQEANTLLHRSRETLSEFLNCGFQEVIITSGGSESDNLAIRGIIDSYWLSVIGYQYRATKTGSRNKFGMTTGADKLSKSAIRYTEYAIPHVITSAIEHHAVLHTVEELEKEGKIEATYIKPGKNGVVKVADIEDAIKPNTILVSIMYVNNEVGTVQPIREIGKLIEKINLQRKNSVISNPFDSAQDKLREKSHGISRLDKSMARDDFQSIFFHTDAVQAAEFFPMNVSQLGVDLLTLTAHKIHGPKGVGVLFVKAGTLISPQITGGEHEFKLRAGTENVASIAGFAAAIEQITKSKLQITNKNPNSKNQNNFDCHSERSEESSSNAALDPSAAPQDDKEEDQDDNYYKVKKLRDKLENFILKNIPETYLNGDKELRAPHIINISFKNAEGEAIILNLDHLGIAVSSGSACTSQKLESSHVLSAMGVPEELSHGAIRFSLSRNTTEKEIDKVCEVLPKIIKKLRQMSPFQ